jgi:hypothetical protein
VVYPLCNCVAPCVIVLRPLLGFGIYNFTYPKKKEKIPPSVSLTTDPVSLGLELDANSHLVSGLVPSGDGSVGDGYIGDGSDGDGSDNDLGLTVSQLGLIERFRKAVLVTEENKRIVKQVEENFIRANKDMRDGVMPAEEGEAVLAVYIRVIEEFLGGKRERAHMGLPGQGGA